MKASFSMRVVEGLLRLKGEPRLAHPERMAVELQKRSYPAPAPIPASLRRLCTITESQVEGRQVLTLTPHSAPSATHILYTHGGAYIHPLVAAHWNIVAQLIRHTGAVVTVPLYPLAPEHTFHATRSLLEAVYRKVLEHTPSTGIILCGDSAGGGLALAQALHYRDLQLPQPARVVLFSPWVDITMSDPGALDVEKHDVMLRCAGLIMAGHLWAGEEDCRHPFLSPLFGDLSRLPPVDIFQGTHDILVCQARSLAQKIESSQGEANDYEYPGAIHDFMAATFTPEAKDCFAKVKANVRL